ncbi:MAG: glycosyltransferase involved in cell wall biosynthesis [Bacteroidia bacterium]|jgi:glycosyltransferase involved in cell wall biosynthesis
MVMDNSVTNTTEDFFTLLKTDINYLRIPSNGLSFARNECLTASTTPYILFIDDDCFVDDALINSCLFALRVDPTAFYSGSINPVLPIHQHRCFDVQKLSVPIVNGTPQFLSGNFMMGAVDAFVQLGGFNLKFGKANTNLNYAEDTLMGRMALTAGIELKAVTNTTIHHLEVGYSTKIWFMVISAKALANQKMIKMGFGRPVSILRILVSEMMGIFTNLIGLFNINTRCRSWYRIINHIGTGWGVLKSAGS